MNRREFTLAALASTAGAVAPRAAAAPFVDLTDDSHAPQVQRQLAKVRANTRGGFQPNWDSLAAYRVPDWFRDAKFGVFLHWGVYSVPAFGNEWYPRNMYLKGNPAYEYHRAVYGPQDRFGYKDFIPRFRAEKFNADAWIDLFAAAGAKYVVPVAEHCDGFPMYDCGFTDWSAAKMGPKRDIVGAIEKAARARGLHFGVSSHRAEHWFWYDGGRSFPSDVTDPRFKGLYGPAAPEPLPADPAGSSPDPSHLERWFPPSRAFLDDWLARTTELVDKYRPELIYLDWWINHPLFAPHLQQLAAYYYDASAAHGLGPVLTYKEEAFAPGTALLDIERGKLDLLRLTPWQTDTSVSIKSWGYVKDDSYRTPKSLVQDLVDVVSKNGDLLLNIGPKADGTIPDEAKAVLQGIGAWLKLNGEAIYGTRPWTFYGEGSTNSGTAEKKEAAEQGFKPSDIRFTTRGDTLYAIGLEPPADRRVLVKSLYAGGPFRGAVRKVELVATGQPLTFTQSAIGLEVGLPDGGGEMPYALKIS